MSSFDHSTPIQQIGQQMTSLRKARPEAMQGFGQLAKAAMAPGVLDEKQTELIALAIGVTQHCTGGIGFHVKALRRLGCLRAGDGLRDAGPDAGGDSDQIAILWKIVATFSSGR